MTVYIFDLDPDDNGTFLATCSAFPEVATFVEDPGELLLHGVGAIEEAIAARISESQDIPAPASRADLETVRLDENGTARRAWVKLPSQTVLKVKLYELLRSENLTRADLGRLLKWNRESVDRLFRLDHGSKLGQMEAALKALGQDLVVDIEARR